MAIVGLLPPTSAGLIGPCDLEDAGPAIVGQALYGMPGLTAEMRDIDGRDRIISKNSDLCPSC